MVWLWEQLKKYYFILYLTSNDINRDNKSLVLMLRKKYDSQENTIQV
jgi:hypothetical protein